MGPWAIRDEANPFRPGCSYDTVKMLIARKRINADTIMRGPSSRQFWMRAANIPGVAHLLGECHACHNAASPSALACTHCGASFAVEEDRQYLGLAEVRLIPDQNQTRRPQAVAAPTPRREPPAPAAFSPTRFVQPIGTLVPDEQDPIPAAPTPDAYEPVRNPARPTRAQSSLDDAQVEALLRRSGAEDRLKRGTGVVVALIILALAGVLGVGGYVAYVIGSGGVAAPGTTPAPATPSRGK
jgi:hypothetical protein